MSRDSLEPCDPITIKIKLKFGDKNFCNKGHMGGVKLCCSSLTFNNTSINTLFLTSCAFDHSMFIFAIRNGFSRFLKSEGGSLVISDFIFASAEYLFNPSPNPIRNVTDITTNRTLNILTSLVSRATMILPFGKKLWLQVVEVTDHHARPLPNLCCAYS